MANIQPRVIVEINPVNPVQEICEITSALLAYHPGSEDLILQKLVEAITQRRAELKGAETNDEPVLQPAAVREDQR